MAERPAKRARLLDEDANSEDVSDQETSMKEDTLTINAEFAKRFEYNKKREDLARLQEKYGDIGDEGQDGDSESDSDSESEDDEAVLATEALDAEIMATLNAIKTKDPRVYDEKASFYTPEGEAAPTTEQTRARPVYLRDYHRENLLKDAADEDGDAPMSYADEQAALKQNVIKELHAADGPTEETDGDEDELLVRKPDQKYDKTASKPVPDVKEADKDPETFLSNFLAARAWLPTTSSRFQPFDSDDDEEDQRAEEFENAYNMRFEDPKRANEKLISHSREAAAKYSVRREEPKGRKRAREEEQTQKNFQKEQRKEEKARYRRLKIEAAHEKLQKFKEAAGLGRREIQMEDWATFLEAGWDDAQWDKEMAKRFGDEYYDEQENGSAAEEDGAGSKKTKKKKKTAKKPTWDNDIDVNDLVPDFKDEDEPVAISDAEEEQQQDDVGMDQDDARPSKKSSKKQAQLDRTEQRRAVRKERAKIEALVDQSMLLDSLPNSSKSGGARFQYRETSPTNYGLSTLDILMADDSQLNQFVGLKKLAPFRDAEKKSKDKKKLGKKARLRQWRKETFGNEDGPQTSFQDFIRPPGITGETTQTDVDTATGEVNTKKKKKRSRKNKGKVTEATE